MLTDKYDVRVRGGNWVLNNGGTADQSMITTTNYVSDFMFPSGVGTTATYTAASSIPVN